MLSEARECAFSLMNQTSTILKCCRTVILLGASGLTICTVSSCNSTPRVDQQLLQRAQAQAHATRSSYHRDQQARDYASSISTEPDEPPNEVRFFRVPVEEHVNEDGLIIEAHKLTLEIIQP
jgi:hypothetical protein